MDTQAIGKANNNTVLFLFKSTMTVSFIVLNQGIILSICSHFLSTLQHDHSTLLLVWLRAHLPHLDDREHGTRGRLRCLHIRPNHI